MSDNKEIVRKYLKQKGLNDKAIAGVMGNIQQESGFSTTALNGGSGAYGLFQWLGGRKTALFNYAKANNSSADNIETQLDFFWYELNTSEKKSKNVLLNSTYETAGDYAAAFEKSFERSGGSALAKRKDYAERIYSEMGGSESIASEIISSGNSSNEYGLKWWGDIVKVVFIIGLVLVAAIMLVLSIKESAIDML